MTAAEYALSCGYDPIVTFSLADDRQCIAVENEEGEVEIYEVAEDRDGMYFFEPIDDAPYVMWQKLALANDDCKQVIRLLIAEHGAGVLETMRDVVRDCLACA